MSSEHMKVQIENALDMLQIISEDVEDNFFGGSVDSAVKARASLIVSSLAVLDVYLRHVCEEVDVA